MVWVNSAISLLLLLVYTIYVGVVVRPYTKTISEFLFWLFLLILLTIVFVVELGSLPR